MKRKNHHSKFEKLRKEYRFFEFQSYSFQLKNKTFQAEFVFNIEGEIWFKPTIKIPERDFCNFEKLSINEIENLVFHIGMVELISYWKAACPPKVVIKCHQLSFEQINWWKKLYFNGLGEFFYLNGIETNKDSFMDIVSEGKPLRKVSVRLDGQKVIVPVGGGKDSVVTLELLKRTDSWVIPMMLNPREASIRTIETAGFRIEDCIVVERRIDPRLLELNQGGFLNGHTPFSALLAFVTALSSAASQSKYIALSNESSASQSTVPGSDINHQYSKSFEFEQDFVWYTNSFVHSKMRYFSFLRPANELQIAKLFSKFPQHFDGFRSCNVGSKTDSWCGKCPKCLFTYIILSPFVSQNTLKKIFGKDLLSDVSLSPIFDELTGRAEVKPFECVGTPEEVGASLQRMIERMGRIGLPGLLKDFKTISTSQVEFSNLIAEFENEHFVPNHLLPILNNEIGSSHLEGFIDFLGKKIANQKVLILGFGKEGQSTFKLLQEHFPDLEFDIADKNGSILNSELLTNFNKYAIHTGPDYMHTVKDFSLVIKSPGVKIKSSEDPVLNKITSQTDLFLQYYKAQTIGVTGTKGKSTTATLINHFLNRAGRKNVLLGNIGTPPFDLVSAIKKDTLVVFELSAHQLEFVHASPHIAVLLNIFPEHLDYFEDFEHYQLAKRNIYKRQVKDDLLIVNQSIAETDPDLIPEQLIFGEDLNFEIDISKIQSSLRGKHNLMNIQASILAVSSVGINPLDTLEYLEDFNPLPHRLEYVGKYDGIDFFNDSISTIPESTMAAVKTLKNVDTLILGGFDRGLDYVKLVDFLKETGIRNFIFLGKAGQEMLEIFQSQNTNRKYFQVHQLKNAFPIIVKNTRRGSICLLSPAAASYDQFHNFEHRGDTFKNLARNILDK